MPGAGGGYTANEEHHRSDVLGRRPHVHALRLPAPAVLTHPGLLRGQAETPGSCRLTRLVSAGCSPEQVALSAGAAPTLPLVFLSFTGNQQVDTVSISQVLSNENLISYNKFVQV